MESIDYPIKVLSDYKNLEYFMTTKLLNRHQAHWFKFLSWFNFQIIYWPGKSGGKPDTLTRRSGDLPKEGDEWLLHQSQTVIKPCNLSILANNSSLTGQSILEKLFDKAYKIDPFPNQVLKMLNNGTRHCNKISLAECNHDGNWLTFRDRLYIPEYDKLHLYLI